MKFRVFMLDHSSNPFPLATKKVSFKPFHQIYLIIFLNLEGLKSHRQNTDQLQVDLFRHREYFPL